MGSPPSPLTCICPLTVSECRDVDIRCVATENDPRRGHFYARCMTFKTLTPKENSMNAKLKQAWRSWSERRRQYQIDRAVYRMGGGGKKAWSYAAGKTVRPVGPTPRVPTEGTTRWSEALYRDDQEADHGDGEWRLLGHKEGPTLRKRIIIAVVVASVLVGIVAGWLLGFAVLALAAVVFAEYRLRAQSEATTRRSFWCYLGFYRWVETLREGQRCKVCRHCGRRRRHWTEGGAPAGPFGGGGV